MHLLFLMITFQAMRLVFVQRWPENRSITHITLKELENDENQHHVLCFRGHEHRKPPF